MFEIFQRLNIYFYPNYNHCYFLSIFPFLSVKVGEIRDQASGTNWDEKNSWSEEQQ